MSQTLPAMAPVGIGASASRDPALVALLARLDIAALANDLVARWTDEVVHQETVSRVEARWVALTARAHARLVLQLLLGPAELSVRDAQRTADLARDAIALGATAENLIAAWRRACDVVWQGLARAASGAELTVLAGAAPRLFGALAILADQLDVHRRHGGNERAGLERDHRAAYALLLAGTPDGALLHSLGVVLGGELRAFELMLPRRGAWPHAEVARGLRRSGALAATALDRVRGLWPTACDLAVATPPAAVVAVGPPTGIADAADAVRSVHGLADAARRTGQVGVLPHTDLLADRLLSASPQVARVLRSQVIEPLETANGNTDLLTTLITLVRCDRDRRRAAGELGVHRNTLDYRLGRIAQLTGLSFHRANDLTILGLAAHLASRRSRRASGFG